MPTKSLSIHFYTCNNGSLKFSLYFILGGLKNVDISILSETGKQKTALYIKTQMHLWALVGWYHNREFPSQVLKYPQRPQIKFCLQPILSVWGSVSHNPRTLNCCLFLMTTQWQWLGSKLGPVRYYASSLNTRPYGSPFYISGNGWAKTQHLFNNRQGH